MNAKKTLMAMALAVTCMAYPQISTAQEQYIFKASEFLTWEKSGQEFYIRTSFGMASFIVSQNSQSQYQCLEAWYDRDKATGYQDIMGAMRKHGDYHPRAILVALMEKKCGALSYTKK